MSLDKIKSDLYYLHKIMTYMGWTDLILTHLSARVDNDCFLISPFSILFDEIKEEDLVLINGEGKVVGKSNYSPNPAGVILHQAIIKNRKDVGCIIHTHTEAGVAISCINESILVQDQMSLMFYEDIAYHDFQGVVLDKEEEKSIIKNLGNKKCLILRNHGLIVTGSTIANALWNCYYLEKMCKIYLSLLPVADNLINVSDEIKNKTYNQHKSFNNFGGLIDGIQGNDILLFESLKRKINSIG